MKHRGRFAIALSLALSLLGVTAATDGQAAVNCEGNTITADVVVLDNPTVFNRLGAQNPNWITYALRRDVVNKITEVPCSLSGSNCTAGNVMLRPDKRPRPLVVRSVEGMCLTVNFQNLLAPNANPNNPIQDLLDNDDQVKDRCASFHAQGVELLQLGGMANDGSFVGNNNPGAGVAACAANEVKGGLVGPGGSITYNLYTPHEGTFVVNSYGATIGSEQSSGNLGVGMFAQLNVQPKGARMYRSQVTEEELRLATTGTVASNCTGNQVPGKDCNPGGQPVIDYEAKYPPGAPWDAEGKAGLPVLNMLTPAKQLVHSDINAIIAGPNDDGTFPSSTYPLERVGKNVPSLPNRLEPFREYSSIFHDEQANSQVFPRWYKDPVLKYTLKGVGDVFMINYGSGGIGSEIIANRLHTGPMHDCAGCAYEEFFLASQTVGDPGMLVQFPANTLIEQCDPKEIVRFNQDGSIAPVQTCWRDPVNLANGPITRLPAPNVPGGFVAVRNIALYQEDPSNVHNGYTGDFVKIRNIHAGAFEQHIFHLHNHQWLFNPNDDNGNYLDAQEIMPGSGHTYELVNGGAGNRNKTVGDAIFHCHFYPHFAQGMWYHIRNYDTFQKGTVLAVSGADDAQNPTSGFHTERFALQSGQPMAGARALPDGELPDGTPIPAVVPLPGKPMPHMPAKVSIVAVDRGDWSVTTGRTPPNALGQGPDSGQAVVDRDSVKGADGTIGTADDISPGFPFWIAGNECGVPTQANPCPMGIVGQRAPTPPLDMLTEAGAVAIAVTDTLFAKVKPAQAGGWDGGLPRHALLGYTSGAVTHDTQNRLDFSKILERAQPVYFPEAGTDLEKSSMAYQAVRNRLSAANNLNGTPTAEVNFVLNGAPPVPGGPFNDPCIDDTGRSVDATAGQFFDGSGGLGTTGPSPFGSVNPRTYKVANVQIDAVFNKVGYHYPQERIIALWQDVAPSVLKQKPPEPLVMRFNTFDCGKILHTNLVPGEFELDDFQVRTPTDIIGQHIHLPKWDLTTNDGAANGWNYEDGTLAPDIVRERIHAINVFNEDVAENQAAAAANTPASLPFPELAGLAKVATIPNPCGNNNTACGTPGGLTHLDNTVAHPFFGTIANPQSAQYLGARTTIQRLFVDPVVNVAGVDRGLGLTFSHDHYGPSSFQQIGLYSTILAEPAGSTWKHNETGVDLYTRQDGGPTTWQAAIIKPAQAVGSVQSNLIPDHREFYFEMSDFQHAYEAGVYVGANASGIPVETVVVQPDPFNATNAFVKAGEPLANTWQRAVNPPLKLKSVPFPDVVTANAGCPGPLNADGTGITNNSPFVPRPCAEAINIGHSSMWVTNYRNEPVGLRVFDPKKLGPDGKLGAQAGGLNTLGVNVPLEAGDLAFAFQSRRDRAIAALNTRFGATPYPTAPYCQGGGGDLINCDRNPGDPFTPIMRAYERDQVKVKIQVGATEEQHQATVHGFKWLSNSSGFGRSPNSGWRNFQSHGISEQFSLQVPLNPDRNQRGNTVDHLYATDATRDGIWSGTWGILRSYGQARQDLFVLPDNPQQGQANVLNQSQFVGVCPDLNRDGIPDNRVQFDVTAVLANDVLPNNLGVTIPPNQPVGGLNNNAGGPLKPNGGTLVYNRRGTEVPGVPGAEGAAPVPGGFGPLNDPTAMLYVRTADLVPVNAGEAVCSLDPLVNPNAVDINPDPLITTLRVIDPATGLQATNKLQLPGCPVTLAANAPVEPLVLRANAGACIEVTLRNRLPFQRVFVNAGPDLIRGTADDVFNNVPLPAPDLAGWQDLFWVVNRDLFAVNRNPAQMRFFNNNLVRPSSYVGLHAQLVEYDASRDDGLVVGGNPSGNVMVPPGGARGGANPIRFYAGDLRHERVPGGNPTQRRFNIVATPVEFGATNLLSADRVKQPQKGLFGALVIEPAGTTAITENTQVPDGQANETGTPNKTRLTRAQVTVTAPAGAAAGSGGTYREALVIGHKIANLRWQDGTAIANIHQGELGREGAEDSGHAGFNYGMEPSWFRFKLPPDVPFGNDGTPKSFGSIPNAHAMYSNNLVATEPNTIPAIPGVSQLGDPVTPVFRATVDTANANPVTDTRMYVLNGASADRDGTFILHGHLWQKDPYVCPGQSDLGLIGRCNPTEPVPSRALGFNEQGKRMGGQEGMGHAYGHWPILFDAGGTDRVPGDYLYRDYTPSGNRNGQFGIFRVSAN